MSETLFHLEGLPVDEISPERNSALQLFAQSARRAQPGFELDGAAVPAVARICRMVDGMPLAIVLAAAWIDTLSADDIAAEIEQSVDILETDLRDVSDRQRSVRAVIDWSWNQVDASAQDLLKRLAVFRGGFTRAAVQEAAGASLRGLSHLVDKALVRRDPKTGRYSIHELLRQYAEEQLLLAADLAESAHEAHARYFADFMATCGMQVRDHRLHAALLAIAADIDNIRTAWDYWAEKQDARSLLAFVEAMWMFFEVRGSFTPAIQFFGDAAKKLTADDPAVVCACAHLQARQAWFTALIGLPEEGLALAQKSAATLGRYYNGDVPVNVLDCVNINAIFLNRIHIVRQVAQDMLGRADRSGDVWERGWALIWSAYAHLLAQQVGEATQAGQGALAIFERLDNPFGVSVASGLILGITSMAAGDLGAAKPYFSQGVQAAEAIEYLRLRQIIYDNLGTVALLEGDAQQARQYFLRSLRISQECGQTREMLASLRDLANVATAEGDLESALQLLAVVLNHPASDQNSLNRPERLRDEAEKLRASIETRLDQPRYQSAWEAGQRRRLAGVVAQILQ
jgi:predicted ATPase